MALRSGGSGGGTEEWRIRGVALRSGGSGGGTEEWRVGGWH